MRKKGKKFKHIISLKLAKFLDLTLIFILLFDYLLYPLPAIAQTDIDNNNYIVEKQVILVKILDAGAISKTVFLDNNQEEENHLPANNKIQEIKWSGHYTITAYNSKAGQTDNSPCITANGFDVCKNGVEDTIAANFLPFGAKVRIPDLFGDKVFVVRDRMHPRHKNRLDIWMINYKDAKQFGVKVAKIEVLE